MIEYGRTFNQVYARQKESSVEEVVNDLICNPRNMKRRLARGAMLNPTEAGHVMRISNLPQNLLSCEALLSVTATIIDGIFTDVTASFLVTELQRTRVNLVCLL